MTKKIYLLILDQIFHNSFKKILILDYITKSIYKKIVNPVKRIYQLLSKAEVRASKVGVVLTSAVQRQHKNLQSINYIFVPRHKQT